MIGSKTLAYRYARALADLGVAQDQLEGFGHELGVVMELLERVPSAARILVLPIFPRNRRENLLFEITSRLDISETVTEFLKLLLEENRFAIFASIFETYGEIVDDIRGRLRAKVYSARPLSDGEKSRISEALKKRMGAEDIVLDCHIDASLIGGVKIVIKSLVLDASLSNQIRRIQVSLEEV